MDAFLLGMTPVGLRCWDASRLVDFLETQEPVDRERIGVTGLSGEAVTNETLPEVSVRATAPRIPETGGASFVVRLNAALVHRGARARAHAQRVATLVTGRQARA